MSEVKDSEMTGRLDPPRLVAMGGDGRIAVTVSHLELGNLVGQLMQMCELNGDIEQREAQKRTIKMKCRDWLDEIYREAGYPGHKHPILVGDPK